MEIRRWKVARDCVLDGSCGIPYFQSPAAVPGIGQQAVEHACDIGVPASYAVYHLDIPVWFFLIISIILRVIDDRTEGMDLRAVDDALRGGNDMNRIFFREAFHDFSGAALFQEGEAGSVL